MGPGVVVVCMVREWGGLGEKYLCRSIQSIIDEIGRAHV